MKGTFVPVLLALAVVAGASEGSSKVTPVQKVIQLLNDMIEKGTAEMNAEETQFSHYSQWCQNTHGEKTRAIKEANEDLEILEADVQKYHSDSNTLAQEIAELDETIATLNGDLAAAMKVRDMEHADFLTAQADYQSSVDALQKGIDTTKSRDHDVMQIQLTQSAKKLLNRPLVGEKARKVILKFLEQDNEDKDADAILAGGAAPAAMLQERKGPSAHAFDSHMAPIIQMFEDMKDKFEGKVSDTEKHETDDLHEYLLLKQDLEHQRATAQDARDTKAEMKAKALQDAADSQGQLADVTSTRDADTTYIHDTDAVCKTKSEDFEQRHKLRNEELEALSKAVEILGGTPKELSEEHLPQLLQAKAARSLMQLSSRAQNPTQAKVAAYLQRKGLQCNSKVLSILALRVAADPFKTVKKMVKDLIVKLMEEATEEAEHKGFCDTELSTNEKTRKAKTEQAEILTAEMDELSASIAETTSHIGELDHQIAELDQAVAEATELRNTEKAKNTATIADAKKGQAAVQGAMKVLAEFYAKAADATALMQQRALLGDDQRQMSKNGQPKIFDDKPYTGMGADSGGVMGMIEVIESDFVRLETETNAQEDKATKEYQDFLNDSELDKTSKKKDLDHKEALKQDKSQALTEKKADLAGTQKELDNAVAYFEKLKPQCISSGESYEEKVARRKEEIESMQEALKILNGEDLVGFGFLQK